MAERRDRLVLPAARFAQLILGPLPLGEIAADRGVAGGGAVGIAQQHDVARHPHQLAGPPVADADFHFGVTIAQRAREQVALDHRAILWGEDVEEGRVAELGRRDAGNPRRRLVHVDRVELQVRHADEVAGVLDQEGEVLDVGLGLPHRRDVDERGNPSDHAAVAVTFRHVGALHALDAGHRKRVGHLVLDPFAGQHAHDVGLDLPRQIGAEEFLNPVSDHLRRRDAEPIGVGLVDELEAAVGPAVGEDDGHVIGHALQLLALLGGRREGRRAPLLLRLQLASPLGLALERAQPRFAHHAEDRANRQEHADAEHVGGRQGERAGGMLEEGKVGDTHRERRGEQAGQQAARPGRHEHGEKEHLKRRLAPTHHRPQ